jgi:multicomponent Na+:H+ antiporter subunit B
MRSLILRTTSRLLLPLLVLFSLFILLRGHSEPGGGFIGGLLAAGGFSLYALGNGARAALQALRVDPRLLIGGGLLVSLAGACAALFAGRPFFTGWWGGTLPGIGKISTVLLFDVGVYLVVIGTTLLIILNLFDQEEG